MPKIGPKFILIFFLVAAGLFLVADFSQAALKWGSDTQTGITTTAGQAGIAKVDWLTITTAAIIAVLSLVGMIFLILLIYGGFLWMTAHGKDDQINKAKKLIVSAVVGLAIVIMAYSLTYFIIQSLPQPTAPAGTGGNMNTGMGPP